MAGVPQSGILTFRGVTFELLELYFPLDCSMGLPLTGCTGRLLGYPIASLNVSICSLDTEDAPGVASGQKAVLQ